MIKSLKGQFILSIFVAIGFVYVNFSSIEFIADKRDPTGSGNIFLHHDFIGV
ncbi:hypothetical protein [Viridibacillus arvi]|uniref:hypothetical protein n=1 Tax=Viridibacillus arvi TaxID=263475 RepID=UPI0034CEC758